MNDALKMSGWTLGLFVAFVIYITFVWMSFIAILVIGAIGRMSWTTDFPLLHRKDGEFWSPVEYTIECLAHMATRPLQCVMHGFLTLILGEWLSWPPAASIVVATLVAGWSLRDISQLWEELQESITRMITIRKTSRIWQ